MNQKLVITYSLANGTVNTIEEYHLNSTAAYTASEAHCKRLPMDAHVESIGLYPVKKHLELVPEKKLSQTDTKYTEVK